MSLIEHYVISAIIGYEPDSQSVGDSHPYHLIIMYASDSWSYKLTKLQISNIKTLQYNTIQCMFCIFSFGITKQNRPQRSVCFIAALVPTYIRHLLVWKSHWNLSSIHEFHETCHSITFYFMKKDSKNAVTPQHQSQFTPKMKANAVPRLFSSLVWIDQYNECNGMTSFMEFMQYQI